MWWPEHPHSRVEEMSVLRMHADHPKIVIPLKSFNKQLPDVCVDFWLHPLQAVFANIGLKYV